MKIIHEREKCIGCGSCVAVCPKYFKENKDGKVDLIEGKFNSETGNYEIEVEEAGCIEEASDVCPVEIIHVND